MVNTVTMTEKVTLQKDSIVGLLRMADWATVCIEAWHEYSPEAVSNIDSYLPQLKEAVTQLCTEMDMDLPQFFIR